MGVSEDTYARLAVEDRESWWELHWGRLRRKPGMDVRRNLIVRRLARQLLPQLSPDEFDVAINQIRIRRSAEHFYIPDLAVIPIAAVRRLSRFPEALEAYFEVMPLVVEVWSLPTDEYSVEEKLREYRAHGDREIWCVKAEDRTLTTWQRQDDGSYDEALFTGGLVSVTTLPGVRVALWDLFEEP